MNTDNTEYIIEVEKKLISALMLKGGEVIPSILDILKPADFYRVEHRVIYAAIIKIYERNEVDWLALEAQLRREDVIDKVTMPYLLSLINQEYTNLRAERYAREIKDASQLRALSSICKEFTDRAEKGTEPASVLLEDIEQKILSATNEATPSVESISEFLARTLEQIPQQSNALIGLDTGLYDLNKVTGGLKKSDLIILAARPSMGKTALALNIASAVARKNVVLMFSLEMSKEQLGQRLISAQSNVPMSKIQQGRLTDDERGSIADAACTLVENKLYVDDTAAITLQHLRNKARRLKHEHGLDLIVVDYIQLMQASKEYRGNRVQEVSELSRGLKALARELDVPILALSQLSRSVEIRADKRPMLSDLRDSGSIEQDADIVMFLYREEYYNHDDDISANLAELIIAKNRNGATTSLQLQFAKEIQRFRDYTRRDDYDY